MMSELIGNSIHSIDSDGKAISATDLSQFEFLAVPFPCIIIDTFIFPVKDLRLLTFML